MEHKYNLSFFKNISRPCMLEFGFYLFQNQDDPQRLVNNLRYLGLDAVAATDNAASQIDKILVTNEGIITPLTEPQHIDSLCKMIITAANNANFAPRGLPHPVFAEQVSTPLRTKVYDRTFAKYADCLPNFMDYMLNQAAQSSHKLKFRQFADKLTTPGSRPPLFSGSTISDPYKLCSAFLNRNMKYATPTLSYALRFTNTIAAKEFSGHRLSTPEGRYFSFLHKYDCSSEQRFYYGSRMEGWDGNFGEGCPIEEVTSRGSETAVFPDINPHRQTFLVWGEKYDYMLFPIPEQDAKWQDFKDMCQPINKWLNRHGKETEKMRCLNFLQNPHQTFLPLINKNMITENFDQFAADQIQKAHRDNQSFSYEIESRFKLYQDIESKFKNCDTSLGKVLSQVSQNTEYLTRKSYSEILAAEHNHTAYQKQAQEVLKLQATIRQKLKKEQQELQNLSQKYPFAHDMRKRIPSSEENLILEKTFLLNQCRTTFKTAAENIKDAKTAHICKLKQEIEDSQAFNPQICELAKLVTNQDRQMFMNSAVETASHALGINKQKAQTALHYACEIYVSAPKTEQQYLLKPLYHLRKSSSKQQNREVAGIIANIISTNPVYQENTELTSLSKIDYAWSKPTRHVLKLINKYPQR